MLAILKEYTGEGVETVGEESKEREVGSGERGTVTDNFYMDHKIFCVHLIDREIFLNNFDRPQIVFICPFLNFLVLVISFENLKLRVYCKISYWSA